MSSLSLEGVSKHWGTAKAVDRATFATASGQLVVLLGPSGCGKSTTLRMIAGLDTPSEGRILIDGRDVTGVAPAARRISMVFQSYALFPHLSVAENILFGVKVRKEPAAEHAGRLARVADLLGLTTLLDRKPSQLSGGQQQRVALGRAIIAESKVCLMDEPLSNLDAQLRQEMRREIRTLQQALGITMVYVTHDQTEAMSMADQVVLLNAGRIEQDAPPAELYARPATVFAARFIGTPPMNIVAAPGRPDLKLGVRPEHVRLDAGGFDAVVQSAEYLGADTVVTCSTSAGGTLADTIAARLPGQHGLAPGARVRLGWSPEHTHWFDAASSRRRDDADAALAA
ncbi:MAG TPA: ABC transporter ATP-binding protein [Caldimonas sp.]|jgi:sn-glycerol 3-phosphate transport system ATP-binding protein|nr:ABC transporter ATP-binding protein [Caldimonas sp.]HEX2541286.1 ABC transporter ATP-binding protein [Caldimonas sp.]